MENIFEKWLKISPKFEVLKLNLAPHDTPSSNPIIMKKKPALSHAWMGVSTVKDVVTLSRLPELKLALSTNLILILSKIGY